MSEFRRNPYENFNLARSFAYNRVIHVGFLGHETRYDEAIACSSFRLAPFRSRSTRPISCSMNRVQQIVDETGLQSSLWDPCQDGIRIRVRCLWLAAIPGAGIMDMLIPPSIKLSAVLDEYCDVMGISREQVVAAKINVREAVRYAFCRRSDIDYEPLDNDDDTNTNTNNNTNTNTSSSIDSNNDNNSNSNSNSKSKNPSMYLLNMAGVKYLDFNLSLSSHSIRDGDVVDIFFVN